MTNEEFEKRVEFINRMNDLGHDELAKQLSWKLWQDLEEPRFKYPEE
jgi:protein gp37